MVPGTSLLPRDNMLAPPLLLCLSERHTSSQSICSPGRSPLDPRKALGDRGEARKLLAWYLTSARSSH
jgi:hypothetical protein